MPIVIYASDGDFLDHQLINPTVIISIVDPRTFWSQCDKRPLPPIPAQHPMVDLRGITNDTHYAGLKITAWSYCNFNFGHTGIDLNSL